jgi:HK97 family phage major capsid protein
MSYIPRSGAEALMPEEFQREIVQSVPQASSIMSLAKRAPNMSRQQKRIPVLSVLPTAYFLNPGPTARSDSSDITRKQLTRQMWENRYLDAEELAVIVAIPETVLDDAGYRIWEEVKPKLNEAFGKAFDAAVYYGTNAPAVWPDSLYVGSIAAGNFVTLGAVGDIYDDIMGEEGVIAKVEEDGFMVTGHVAALSMRAKLRGLRDGATGQPIFKALYKEGVQGATRYELDGEQVIFPRNGAVDADKSLLICGDWSQLIYAIRQDVTWKVLDQAIIQDTDGSILYNLAQQDMVAIRAVMRIAWQIPNPINRINEDEDTRYPFAVLGNPGS